MAPAIWPFPLSLEDLSAACDEPHTRFGRHVGVSDSLHQRERAPANLPGVLAKLRGGSRLPVPVQPHKVHDRLLVARPGAGPASTERHEVALIEFDGLPD